jgi:hypothetical protein
MHVNVVMDIDSMDEVVLVIIQYVRNCMVGVIITIHLIDIVKLINFWYKLERGVRGVFRSGRLPHFLIKKFFHFFEWTRKIKLKIFYKIFF